MPPVPSVVVRRRLGRQPALDGLRAIAVLLVMFHHGMSLLWWTKAHDLLPGGVIGVDIFFVLSGFLITSLLFGEMAGSGRVRLGAFYARRALRLFPALYVMLVVTLLVDHYDLDRSVGSLRHSGIPIALYVGNWVQTKHPASVQPGLFHLWSLAVEEQFYLVWPFVFLLGAALFRWRPRTWALVAVLGIVGSYLVKLHVWGEAHYWQDLYYRTDARADSLLFGVLLGVVWTSGVPLRWLRPLVLPALVGLGWIVAEAEPTQPWFNYGGYTLTAVCAAVVVAGVLHGSAARVDVLARAVSWRPLRHLGRISYGLYLWHVPVAVMIGTHGRHWPVLVKFGLLFGVSVVLAEVSMLLVERPFLRWKARFDTRRAPVASDAAPARRELQPAA